MNQSKKDFNRSLRKIERLRRVVTVSYVIMAYSQYSKWKGAEKQFKSPPISDEKIERLSEAFTVVFDIDKKYIKEGMDRSMDQLADECIFYQEKYELAKKACLEGTVEIPSEVIDNLCAGLHRDKDFALLGLYSFTYSTKLVLLVNYLTGACSKREFLAMWSIRTGLTEEQHNRIGWMLREDFLKVESLYNQLLWMHKHGSNPDVITDDVF